MSEQQPAHPDQYPDKTFVPGVHEMDVKTVDAPENIYGNPEREGIYGVTAAERGIELPTDDTPATEGSGEE